MRHTYDSAANLFNAVYNGQSNFLTPTRLRFGWHGDYAYELSTGEGISRRPVYGVTVINSVTRAPEHDFNTLFESQADAEAYIKSGFNPARKPV